MKNNKRLLLLFIIVALIQLAIPFKMILNEEMVITEGTPYKFKVAPVDPNDPFRGKYIALRFQETTYTVNNEEDWERNQTIYVVLTTDANGFMKIKKILAEKPNHTPDYIKADISYISNNKLHLKYPFDRYYMEESKAYEAEQYYNESLRDTMPHETYALVYVKDAKAVLQDVLIDDVSIKDIVINNRALEVEKYN